MLQNVDQEHTWEGPAGTWLGENHAANGQFPIWDQRLTPWIFLEWQWAKQPIGQAFSNTNADNAPIHTVVKFPVSDSHGVSSPCRSNCELSKPPFSRQPRVLTLWWLGRTTKLRLRNSPSSPNSQGFENSRSRDLLEEGARRTPPISRGNRPGFAWSFMTFRFNPADMGHFHWRLSTAACFVKQMLSAQAVLLAERPSFLRAVVTRNGTQGSCAGWHASSGPVHSSPLLFRLGSAPVHGVAWVQHGTAWASVASGLLVAPPPKNGSGLLAPEVWVSLSRSYDENVWTTIFTVSCKGAMQWCHTQLWFEARLSSRMKLSIGWTPLHTSAGRNLSSARNGLSLSQAFRAPLAPRGGPGVPWCPTWEPMARPWTCWIVRVVRLVVKWCEVPKLYSDLNQYLKIHQVEAVGTEDRRHFIGDSWPRAKGFQIAKAYSALQSLKRWKREIRGVSPGGACLALGDPRWMIYNGKSYSNGWLGYLHSRKLPTEKMQSVTNLLLNIDWHHPWRKKTICKREHPRIYSRN